MLLFYSLFNILIIFILINFFFFWYSATTSPINMLQARYVTTNTIYLKVLILEVVK